MKDKLLVETIIGIFTVDKNSIKVLMMKKKKEPYKGYWMLPNDIMNATQTLEDCISEVVYENLGIKKIYIEQKFSYSNINRKTENRTLGVSYLGLTDYVTITYNIQEKEDLEIEWFDINNLPKLAYDHEYIIGDLLKNFKKRILNSHILKVLFPADFTLPELQYIYEYALDKKLDRRNFRKKLLQLDIIEDTGLTNDGFSGRPPKLYRLTKDLTERKLF